MLEICSTEVKSNGSKLCPRPRPWWRSRWKTALSESHINETVQSSRGEQQNGDLLNTENYFYHRLLMSWSHFKSKQQSHCSPANSGWSPGMVCNFQHLWPLRSKSKTLHHSTLKVLSRNSSGRCSEMFWQHFCCGQSLKKPEEAWRSPSRLMLRSVFRVWRPRPPQACGAALGHLIRFINAPSRPSAPSSRSPLWFQPVPSEASLTCSRTCSITELQR